jgi:uncharacterized membrane protein YgcG
MRVLRVVSLMLLAWLLVLLSPLPVQAQDRSLYWGSYDVAITVQPDGCFRVVETHELVFTVGTFRYGVRTIPTEFTSSISDVTVAEPGGDPYRRSASEEPYTFDVTRSGGDLNVRYNFPPTSDASRTIVIGYTVCGGLLYYPGGDQLVWKAVPSNSSFPIQNASVTVRLPGGVTIDNYDATGPSGTATLLDNSQAVRFVATEPIRPGSQDFAVRVQWPSGPVAGQPASWQISMDRQDRIEPIANLAILALTALVLVGGLLGLYLLWYSRGRDAPVKLPAEWIPEPPSDLPAGMVGTLIDEHADTKDVMATLVDLARRGVLAIQEESKPGLFGIGKTQEFIYHLEDSALPMRPYEQLLVDKLFGDEQSKKLSDLREKFYVHMGQVQKALYQSVVDDGYFPHSPERVRTSYAGLGVAALILAFVVGCFATIFLVQWSGFAICLPIAFAIPAIGLIVLARYMPRKSEQGAEEAAKWMAFKRYMQNIEQYTKVDEVKEIFDRYLPYAIAFGLEQSWIAKFARVDAPPPPWYYPGPYMGPRPRGWGWWGAGPMVGPSMGPSPRPESGGSGAPAPSMSDMSRGMGAGLAGMSAGLGGMLTAATGALTSRPAAQAGTGSWSSGGGSWSGGGGFSGGGWSGGGGFSGGGGGGSSFG